MEIGRDESGALSIEGALDISVAAELQDALRRFIGESDGVIIDLSKVESCDTTAMQVFCAAKKSAETSGKQIHFMHPSDSITHTSDRLGFAADVLSADSAGEPAGAIPDSGT